MKTRTFLVAGLAVHARTITTTPHLIFRRAWLWTGCLAFATIAFGPQPAQTAVTEAWVQRYGSVGGSEDSAYKDVTDAAGNVIVAGTTRHNQTGSGSDMLIIKYSDAGVPLWTNRYNGPANSDDFTQAVAVDASGNVFVTGYSASTNDINSPNYDFATVAYSGAGVPLWTNRYNGTANGGDHTTAMAVNASGNVFVTGTSYGSGSSSDYATIAYSGAGVPLWTNLYHGPANRYDGATAVAVDGSGNVFVTGYSFSSGGGYDYATIAYSNAGVPLWTNRYDGPANIHDSASAVAVDSSGKVFVTGSSYGSGSSSDYATIAYSGAGVPLWTNRCHGPANSYDGATAVAVDGSGNVFVTGSSASTSDFPYNYDYATIAYSSAGVTLWTKRYGGPGNLYDEARAVAVDGSGNVFVTGTSAGGGGNSDYATIAYSGAGVTLWINRYTGTVKVYDQASAVAVDGSGNVFVTGSSYVNSDYATIAYSGAGVPLWTNRYNGSDNSNDGAAAVAVDGSGNVFVTGYSYGSGGNSDYATIAYSGAGVPLWTNRYDGSDNRYDGATAVAVDGSGNVFVTGSSYRSEGAADWATIAYSGAGVPLWTNRYNGPGNSFDRATAVAVDGSGNVFVTGSSYGSGGNSDYATIAYSGAGVPLWTNRYNGPDNGHDQATAVAVDASGNVFVTGGSSDDSGDNDDYATIAYSGAGVPLWTNLYNGPANREDFASAVAVDGSGNVFVTGYSFSSGGGYDYATIAYSSAGVPLWTNRYDGPANILDSASAVAVDGSGNVVVTGWTDGSRTENPDIRGDYYTAKYAGTDGAILWEKRFNRLPTDGGSPPCLALGPNGMVVVSGSSSGDFATIVYREVPTVSIDLIPTGIRLRFTGVPDRTYNIERAPAVTGPWNTINTQTAPASGLLEYLDTLPHPGSGFYRIVQP